MIVHMYVCIPECIDNQVPFNYSEEKRTDGGSEIKRLKIIERNPSFKIDLCWYETLKDVVAAQPVTLFDISINLLQPIPRGSHLGAENGAYLHILYWIRYISRGRTTWSSCRCRAKIQTSPCRASPRAPNWSQRRSPQGSRNRRNNPTSWHRVHAKTSQQ